MPVTQIYEKIRFYYSFIWPAYLNALQKSRTSELPAPSRPFSNITLLTDLLDLLLHSCRQDLSGEKTQSSFGTSQYVLQSHQFMKAVARFNNEDKTVFEFLSSCGRTEWLEQRVGLMSKDPTPWEIARFLRSSSLLDKKQIGEYLGKNKDLNKAVLQEYVRSFNFSDSDVLSALRMFLESFRLPGESQQIDRIIEVRKPFWCDE